MGTALFTNNAYSTLASGITDVATTATVAAGEGTRYPSPTGGDFFYATLIDTSNNLEIIKCTTRSTDTLTIVRAQESTTGRAYSAGDRIELRVTAAGLTETVTASATSETNAATSETNAATSETNAATSESNADADATATAADVVSTNADVVTTNADAATTTQDAIDTAADVVSTNADVVSTNADVVSTNADVVTSTGEASAAQPKFTFSTTTAMADPGAGILRYNNATVASVTAIAIDDTTADAGNPDIAAWIASWDDSSSTVKGYLRIVEPGTPANYAVFDITGLTDNAGWTELAVTHVDSNSTFADTDSIRVMFSRTGDIGATGGGMANVVDDTTPQLGGDLDLNGNVITGLVIGTNVQAYDADNLISDVDDVLTAGFGLTDDDDGTKSSGSYTPIYSGGNGKKAVNGGAFTLAPMAESSSLVIQLTNNASAGAVTTSGWTIVTGDSLTTTNADDFMLYCNRINGFSHLHITALQ